MVKKYVWTINAGLILAAVALSAVLISGHARKAVHAQSSMEVGNVIAIAGQYRDRDDEPLFVIDTKDQVMMVYEYQIQTNWFSLRAVRRMEWDMQESDMLFAPIGTGAKKVGARVKDVQELIEKESKR